MDNDENGKDNEQQRRKSSRTTAGKDTRKKYADDTELQQQLARTPTKGIREGIQSDTMTSEISGRDMENGEIMTALELAVKMGAITNSKLNRPIVILDESFLDLTESPMLTGGTIQLQKDNNNAKIAEVHVHDERNNNVMTGLQENEEDYAKLSQTEVMRIITTAWEQHRHPSKLAVRQYMRLHHGRVYVTKRELISFKSKIIKHLMQKNNIAYSPDMKRVPLYDNEEVNSISSKSAIEMLVMTITNPITAIPNILKTAANGTNIPSYMRPAIYFLEDEVKQQQYDYDDRSPVRRKLEQLIDPKGLYDVEDGEIFNEYKKHIWLHTPSTSQPYQSPAKERNDATQSKDNRDGVDEDNNSTGIGDSNISAAKPSIRQESPKEDCDSSDSRNGNDKSLQGKEYEYTRDGAIITNMEQKAQEKQTEHTANTPTKLPSNKPSESTSVYDNYNIGDDMRNIMEGHKAVMDAIALAADNTGSNLLLTQDYAAVYQEVDDMYATDDNQLSETSTQNPSEESDRDDPQYSPEGSHSTHVSSNECDRDHLIGTTN
jgi:hypothetical protein